MSTVVVHIVDDDDDTVGRVRKLRNLDRRWVFVHSRIMHVNRFVRSKISLHWIQDQSNFSVSNFEMLSVVTQSIENPEQKK